MMFMAEYISNEIRIDTSLWVKILYPLLCSNRLAHIVTSTVIAIMRAWECQGCKQLIANVDLPLLAKSGKPELLHA